jgi:GT2 family glycosyltransferase
MKCVNHIAAVVVAYHNADLLDRCLSLLPRDLLVWVIDNSSDAGVKAVAAAHAAEYVDTGSNLGFAGGVNTGLRLVPPDSDVLLLNPDATITAEALRALHASLYTPGSERLGAVSPALADPVGHARQRVRWPLPSPGRMWREAFGLSRLLPPGDEFSVGAVLLLRAEAIVDVGPFDERFFLYAEEADWQRRALQRGWLTAERPDIVALHVGAGTSEDASHRDALFHAGQETYIRKWYGSSGWTSYRAAALLSAMARRAALRGPAAAAAGERARLYFHGPHRVAQLGPRESAVGRRVTHVVVTDAFAGVERYVCEVAREQAARGSIVTVVGGDPGRMPEELGGATHVPSPDLRTATAQLARLGRQDVVHAHMTAAELAAVAAGPWHRGRVVSTRHFAGGRGSTPLARILGRVVRRRIDVQIAISHFVAEKIGEPALVVPNGVRSQAEGTNPRQNVVLCLQRLEREKATDVALRASQ